MIYDLNEMRYVLREDPLLVRSSGRSAFSLHYFALWPWNIGTSHGWLGILQLRYHYIWWVFSMKNHLTALKLSAISWHAAMSLWTKFIQHSSTLSWCCNRNNEECISKSFLTWARGTWVERDHDDSLSGRRRCRRKKACLNMHQKYCKCNETLAI